MLAYLRAKDGNRPHLMAQAFTRDATLSVRLHTDGIVFPPFTQGREAIGDLLARRFGQVNENVYTFCLTAPPLSRPAAVDCDWLVAMSNKDDGDVRVGCGRYDWRFAADSGLAERLRIDIDVMSVLPPSALDGVMAWVRALPYPWCPAATALAGAPEWAALAAARAYLEGDSGRERMRSEMRSGN